MPKILRVINRLNIGGPTYNAAYLTRYLAPEFDTVLVAGNIDHTEGDSSYVARDLGVNPVYVPDMHRSLHPVRDWRGYWQVRNLIRKHKPDIVHTHAAKAGALGRLAAYHERVPVIVHTFHGHVFHSYFSPAKTRFYLEIERRLGRISSGIVAISPLQKQELTEQFNIAAPEKFEVIPNGFDLDRFQHEYAQRRIDFRLQWNLADDVVAIGIVGRLVPVKNHRLFLEGLAALLQRTQTQVKAFIIGDGEDRPQIVAWATALGLSVSTPEQPDPHAVVVFTSWIKQVEYAYPGLDLVVLTSLNEGTPVSLVEAQAAALPVVSTRVGGVADVVADSHTGLLVPTGDVQALAHAMQELVDSQRLRVQYGEAGRQHAFSKYGFQRLVDDMARFYRRLLDQRR